jgi:hypothetical protein
MVREYRRVDERWRQEILDPGLKPNLLKTEALLASFAELLCR